MLTRMQPIGNVLSKFPRLIRDLSKKQDKEIDLSLIGQEVELDKTIIEAINEPLTHLVRNSIDPGHRACPGTKGPGKNPRGAITIKAYHAAGQVIIEISDDGRGIDGDQLAERAVAKGLIHADQAKLMSAKERINLILLPELSADGHQTSEAGRECRHGCGQNKS
jgi:two-component system, chemotaxis family, sensor kinase CheA